MAIPFEAYPPPPLPRALPELDDLGHAESVLHDLAVELLHVPVDGPGRRLHVRALDLKRRLGAQRDRPAGAGSLGEVFDELSHLRDAARAIRRLRARRAAAL